MTALAYSEGPIEDASVTIEALQAEIAESNRRKYAFDRWLHATDQVLWKLEDLNLEGVRRLAAGATARIRASLDELPAAYLEVFRDSERVQEVLDGVFDVQDRLFRWRSPGRPVEDDESEGAVV